jgi:hypothetical protein
MSVKTLQEICYDSLATSMENAPPLLQEMIMGETSDKLAKRLKKQLKRDLTNSIREKLYDEVLKKVTQDLCAELPSIITTMLQENLHNTSSYSSSYNSLDPLVLECATQVAADVSEVMESHYQRDDVLNRYNLQDEYDSDDSTNMIDIDYNSYD